MGEGTERAQQSFTLLIRETGLLRTQSCPGKAEVLASSVLSWEPRGGGWRQVVPALWLLCPARLA